MYDLIALSSRTGIHGKRHRENKRHKSAYDTAVRCYFHYRAFALVHNPDLAGYLIDTDINGYKKIRQGKMEITLLDNMISNRCLGPQPDDLTAPRIHYPATAI